MIANVKPCLHLHERASDHTRTIFWTTQYSIHISTLPQRHAIDVARQIRRAGMFENKFDACAVALP